MDNAPLMLDDLLFPLVEMRTNGKHDPQGNRAGTQLQYGQQVQKIEGQAGRYGLMVSVRSDDSNSTNPPYSFNIEAYALFNAGETAADNDETVQRVVQQGLPIVMGAIRQKLAELTSRAPWGRFLINAVALPQPVTITFV
jgi:hypothetical protein